VVNPDAREVVREAVDDGEVGDEGVVHVLEEEGAGAFEGVDGYAGVGAREGGRHVRLI